MSVPKLITIKAAAREIGVPATELEASAREDGFLVLMRAARTIRIEKSSLIELVKEYRENPNAHASTGGLAKGMRKGVYVIGEGSKEHSTGIVDSRATQAALNAYLTRGSNQPHRTHADHEVGVAEILAVYGEASAEEVSDRHDLV